MDESPWFGSFTAGYTKPGPTDPCHLPMGLKLRTDEPKAPAPAEPTEPLIVVVSSGAQDDKPQIPDHSSRLHRHRHRKHHGRN